MESASSSDFDILGTLHEMVQIQERLFKSLFDSILTNDNLRIDNLTRPVADIQANLNKTPKDVEDLKERL